MSKNVKGTWDKHWSDLDSNRAFFSKFTEFYRKNIISNSVRCYIDKYFKEKGVFVECGSGTSQSSIKIHKQDRYLIALDISQEALKKAKDVKVIDKCVQGDILNLPFGNRSIEGIWNLGVMEHFDKKDIDLILSEFHRVLKDDGTIILFWPPKFGSSAIIIGFIEKIAGLFGKHVDFFPDEISLLNSKKEAENIVLKNKFSECVVEFNHRDLFTHCVVICKK